MGKKSQINTPHELRFIQSGKLNMLIVRSGKEISKVDAYTDEFLTNPQVVARDSMDQTTFLPNIVFKVTLDFSKPKVCVQETAIREATDWVLCSCMGGGVRYDKTAQRLIMQSVVVCVQSNVKQLELPFGCVLVYTGKEWEVEAIMQ
jgi:hypothetical protein